MLRISEALALRWDDVKLDEILRAVRRRWPWEAEWTTSAFGCYISRRPIKKSRDGERADLGDEDGPRKN
ncbi:unnamed protein product [Caenorhabditis auriculariae]|uniref:Uncharacterized protein n=1 Tax=Caenorhabditis auriculariae TaxID=2777116 RepID=A0A8S1HPM2_9PELO|nr:unnamed protein product [Caenorhabditis auriculariae]